MNLKAWVKITRPPIWIIAMLGASVGALNTSLEVNLNFLLMLIGAFALSAFLMIHNDIWDLTSDRINHPEKPLCLGQISIIDAGYFAFMLEMVAILMVIMINRETAILTVALIAVGTVYNMCGKLWGIWGHIMVAFGVAAIPVYGAAAMGNFMMMVPLAVFIFMFEIGREIAVCIGDYEGDKKAGWRTYPVIHGKHESWSVSALFIVSSAFLIYLPFHLGIFGWIYLWGATAFLSYLFWAIIMVHRSGLTPGAYDIWFRWGSRIAILLFQVVLLVEAFVG